MTTVTVKFVRLLSWRKNGSTFFYYLLREFKLADKGRVFQSGLDALKIIKKIIRFNVFEQNINKLGLEFNLGLVLLSAFEQLGLQVFTQCY